MNWCESVAWALGLFFVIYIMIHFIMTWSLIVKSLETQEPGRYECPRCSAYTNVYKSSVGAPRVCRWCGSAMEKSNSSF